jgi:hypothetical protein
MVLALRPFLMLPLLECLAMIIYVRSLLASVAAGGPALRRHPAGTRGLGPPAAVHGSSLIMKAVPQ